MPSPRSKIDHSIKRSVIYRRGALIRPNKLSLVILTRPHIRAIYINTKRVRYASEVDIRHAARARFPGLAPLGVYTYNIGPRARFWGRDVIRDGEKRKKCGKSEDCYAYVVCSVVALACRVLFICSYYNGSKKDIEEVY